MPELETPGFETGKKPDITKFLEQTKKINGYTGSVDMEQVRKDAPDIFLFIKENKNAGYDCHTFMVSILNKIGLKHPWLDDGEMVPSVQMPAEIARENFESEDDYFAAVVQHAYKLDDAKRQKFKVFWTTFEDVFFLVSKKQNLNCVSSLLARHAPDFEKNEKLRDQESKEQTQSNTEILEFFKEKLRQARLPKILAVTLEKRDGNIIDLHSSLIVGPNKDANDYWMIERLELDSPVQLVLLSDAIHNYNRVSEFTYDESHEYATLNFSIVESEQKILDFITPEMLEK